MNKIKYTFLILILLIITVSCKKAQNSNPDKIEQPPNIVIIYMDDLGYGDVSYNNSGTLKTPNIDKLALAGVRFSNGYAASSTCTPSRYAILTGTYPWREKNAKILPGTAPLLIDTAQMTLPKMLKTKG
ncbi:sulfatase-like hydrolase/transferase, partial [Eudoraea sp.]|uniref:sulfatase-like hydrolase/transferase n=1 Tax=Eudoraea sp. TaxID=1979955 RepID=UPI003C78B69D